jgi:hypothetical protein
VDSVYHRAILHLGIHDLPRAEARRLMAIMAAYTAAPDEARLPLILGELSNLTDDIDRVESSVLA